jgi:hypothetical protein
MNGHQPVRLRRMDALIGIEKERRSGWGFRIGLVICLVRLQVDPVVEYALIPDPALTAGVGSGIDLRVPALDGSLRRDGGNGRSQSEADKISAIASNRTAGNRKGRTRDRRIAADLKTGIPTVIFCLAQHPRQ